MLEQHVKSFGQRGKCYRFRDHDLIKNMKAVPLLSAIAWGGGAFAMRALRILRTSAGGVAPELVAECSWFLDTGGHAGPFRLHRHRPFLFHLHLTGLFPLCVDNL